MRSDIMIKVSPSVLGVDFLDCLEALETAKNAGADMLHIDVMDGIFVPNISFGVPVLKSFRKHSDLPMDVHLMIDRPHRYIEEFAKYADLLGFHYEAGSPVKETLLKIRELGCKSCLTIKPATPASAIFEFLPYCDMVLVMSVEPGFGGQSFIETAPGKIAELKAEIDRLGIVCDIEVDGGINDKTAKLCTDAGANVLVAGNYVFAATDVKVAVESLKNL